MVRYATIAEEPNLRGLLSTFKDSWPEFMLHDPVAECHYGEMVDHYPGLQALLLEDDLPVAKSHAIGFVWSGELDLTAAGTRSWSEGWPMVEPASGRRRCRRSR